MNGITFNWIIVEKLFEVVDKDFLDLLANSSPDSFLGLYGFDFVPTLSSFNTLVEIVWSPIESHLDFALCLQ